MDQKTELEMMGTQAAALVVVMVCFVVSRLRRFRGVRLRLYLMALG
jgi:hypothetical protein